MAEAQGSIITGHSGSGDTHITQTVCVDNSVHFPPLESGGIDRKTLNFCVFSLSMFFAMTIAILVK